MRRPTMQDVAAEAGVSLKTVSRVVNDEPGVTPPLVERVRNAIDHLGYHPDDRARHLRSSSNTTRTIGFIQNDVANPFFSSIYRGLENVARDHGFLVLAGSSDADPERERALVATLVARRVDGLVVVSTDPEPLLIRAEMSRGTPVVFVDLLPVGIDADVVLTDHFDGARMATTHLIGYGHRRIAFIGDDLSLFSASERARGYRAALLDAGLAADPRIVLGGAGSPAVAYRTTRDILTSANPPTAIFTAQNFVSIGALRALHEMGLQHRVAHVGFDAVELADVVRPGLSVVPQDPLRLGQAAGERLFARLAGRTRASSVVRIPTTLIARGSGEIPPPSSP